MFQPTSRMDARKYEFKELVASNVRLIALMTQLRDHFPDAFAALIQKLDADWDERVAEEEAQIAPASAALDEGELEPSEGDEL